MPTYTAAAAAAATAAEHKHGQPSQKNNIFSFFLFTAAVTPSLRGQVNSKLFKSRLEKNVGRECSSSTLFSDHQQMSQMREKFSFNSSFRVITAEEDGDDDDVQEAEKAAAVQHFVSWRT